MLVETHVALKDRGKSELQCQTSPSLCHLCLHDECIVHDAVVHLFLRCADQIWYWIHLFPNCMLESSLGKHEANMNGTGGLIPCHTCLQFQASGTFPPATHNVYTGCFIYLFIYLSHLYPTFLPQLGFRRWLTMNSININKTI